MCIRDREGNDTIDVDEDGIPDFCDLLVDSDGDGYDDAIDAFPEDNSEWIDSDGDGVGNNADAFPADSNRSEPEESTPEKEENGDETKQEEANTTDSETKSWIEFMDEKGINSEFILKIAGVLILLILVKMKLSSRRIKKLKKELDEVSESKTLLERIDFDGDGEISDAEFEAYKLIRDKDKQEENPTAGNQNPVIDESLLDDLDF